MAMIIRLNRVTEASQDEAVLDEMRRQDAAEVVLFPGVRYERWTDEQNRSVSDRVNTEGQPTKIRRQRDWLDI